MSEVPLPPTVQYYDDAAGILRSIILSALAPHRLSMPVMPMPAFSMTPDQVLLSDHSSSTPSHRVQTFATRREWI